MHAFITRAAAPVGDCHATAGRKKNSPTSLTEADLNIYLISLATRSWHGFKWGYSLLGEPMPRPRYHIELQRKRHTMDVSPRSERYFKMHKVKFGGLPDPLHLFRLSYFRPGIYMATLTLHVSFLLRQKTIPQICGTVSEIVKWTYPSPVAWLAICGFYHHSAPISIFCAAKPP